MYPELEFVARGELGRPFFLASPRVNRAGRDRLTGKFFFVLQQTETLEVSCKSPDLVQTFLSRS